MHVKVLDYVVYSTDGRSWHTEKVKDPSWEQIEQAVRRLDRYHHPFLFLWPTHDESKHFVDGSCEVFEIIGGEGAYWIAGSFGGYFQRRMLNPAGGEQEIRVWTSDQGFADAERHICRDLEAVIHAARHYADHGGFDPALVWEEGST
jgi:hypothetical protein